MEMELFIGVGLPEKETLLMDTVRREFSPKNRIGSPSHITLTGPFKESEPEKFAEKVKICVQQIKKFEAFFGEIGIFEQARYVTFYLKPQETENFADLKQIIEKYTGLNPEIRQFIPHLTIANQIPYSKKEEIYERLKMLGLELKIEVDSVILFTKKKDKSWEVWQKLYLSNNI